MGTVAAKLKGGAGIPWVMDLNPDEAVAAGWLKQGGIVERVLTFVQNWSFRQAARIVALDRFMADRLIRKGVKPQVIHTDAPWSHDQSVRIDVPAREAFCAKHGFSGHFVVTFYGNSSPCHPLVPAPAWLLSTPDAADSITRVTPHWRAHDEHIM